MERKVAKVKSTSLGTEDHGILTAWLAVEYGEGLAQGIGGFALDEYDKNAKRRVGTAFGCEWIMRVQAVCGVDSWEKIAGRTIYVICDPDQPMGFGSKVVGIAPLPTEPGVELLFADLADEFSEAR